MKRETIHTQAQARGGFTLLEVVVVMTMMTILTIVVLTALPVARTNQLIESDVQQIRSFVAQAQQQSLNEIRSEECVGEAGSDEDAQRRCSDVGIAMMNQMLVMFSDSDGNGEYDESDFVLEEKSLSVGVENGETISVVFAASPPIIITYGNGQVLGAGQVLPLNLVLENSTRSLTIGPYGVIEYAQ